MNNPLSSFSKSQVRWAAVSSRLVFIASTFPCAEGHFQVWKTRNVVQSQKALVHHAVAMETEFHARNWSFGIGPSSTVITSISRRTTSAMTGLMLFTTRRANAIQTLLDITAASASLATMEKTANRKKTLTHQNFLKLSSDKRDQSMRYINVSRYYISDYVVTLSPYEEINKTVMANRDSTVLFHNISNYDLFVWMHYYAAGDTIFPHNITRADIYWLYAWWAEVSHVASTVHVGLGNY